VNTLNWSSDGEARRQLVDLVERAAEPGVVVIRFDGGAGSGELSWADLEPWRRSRAVTVAAVAGDLQPPALDVALLCDLVFVQAGASISFGRIDQPPTAGMALALARAGRVALARGLLEGGRISAEEAVRIGLAHETVASADQLPLPDPSSVAAMTAARDLMRSGATGEPGRALELATFRLLFASGDPEEGARAFLDRRPPTFPTRDD